MPKQRSIHAGGYTAAGAARLKNLQLPQKIKCAVCHKIKAVNFYSTIQQNTLRNAIAVGNIRDATVEEWVPCVSCTPKQVTELECCICSEVKGLEGFAKAQRRLGEEARCIACVAELNGDVPVEGTFRDHLKNMLGDSDDDSDDDDESVSNVYESSTFSGDTSANAGVPVSSGSGYDLEQEDLRSLSISSDGRDSKASASKPATSAFVPVTKRTRVAARTGNWQNFTKENGGESVEPTSGAEFTGYDHAGNAHRMVRPTSTVGSEDSDNDTILDPVEEARLAKQERDARSRFARIPGGRNVPVAVPSYYGGKTVADPKPDYDDDDDDDWGTI